MHGRAAIAGYAHVFPPTFPPPPEDDFVRRWSTAIAAESPWTATVAEHAGAIIGAVMYGPDPDRPDGGHLARLYVEPVRWGEGVGGVLHDHALRGLVDAGHTDATLWVLTGNERAHAWYRRSGWVATGVTRPVIEEVGIDEHQLRRHLRR